MPGARENGAEKESDYLYQEPALVPLDEKSKV